MLEGLDLFRLAGERMRYLTERQAVITRNIANADTPHYRAQDLAPFSFESTLLRSGSGAGEAPSLAMARTSAAHLGMGSGGGGVRIDRFAKATSEKPNGNTVSLEEQMVKSTEVANAFDLASAAYSKSITLMKIGIDFGK
ncbi:MAG TPA: flagellar basal body protein [Acetobacteraceae bacterium]|nr:flagellar basal body protein [Acetobacteraceae bacterium]